MFQFEAGSTGFLKTRAPYLAPCTFYTALLELQLRNTGTKRGCIPNPSVKRIAYNAIFVAKLPRQYALIFSKLQAFIRYFLRGQIIIKLFCNDATNGEPGSTGGVESVDCS